MSGLDLYGGMQMQKMWRNIRGDNDSGWQAQAQRLQQRLNQSEESLVLGNAEFDANNHVLRLALAALEKLDPTSPLLNKGHRDSLRREHIAVALKERGYRFDTNGVVQRKHP